MNEKQKAKKQKYISFTKFSKLIGRADRIEVGGYQVDVASNEDNAFWVTWLDDDTGYQFEYMFEGADNKMVKQTGNNFTVRLDDGMSMWLDLFVYAPLTK